MRLPSVLDAATRTISGTIEQNRTYLWPAIISGVVGLLVFLLIVSANRLLPRVSGQSLADAPNITGVAVNVVLLVLGLLSLVVAIAAFRDAQQSGLNQQVAFTQQQDLLGRSNDALTSVIGALDRQRELMDKTYDAATNHLNPVQRSYEEEQENRAAATATARPR